MYQFKSSSSNKSIFTNKFSFSSFKKRKPINVFSSCSAFTLTELIVVITILSILSVIGFVVMSHESSVARDGKRISDIKTLSESARITSAQLRKLPTPIADSVSLSVSGSFIGYQGFMSLALVNPLGYGSDKIFDPKDNIPYTYRVNQHYDQAQFLAYLENPRFERTIEIAGRGRMQEIASQSLTSTLPSNLPSLFSQAYTLDTAYALDSSTTDLSSRYPYSAGDRLGIFVSKGSNQPLQNGVTGTGSRDISLSDASTLDIIVGSQGDDEYISTDISTGSLLSLKDGSFGEDALRVINSGTGSNGSGTGSGDGGGSGNDGYVLTMGVYDYSGSPYAYGYLGPLTAALFGGALTPNPAGDLTPKTIGGKNIDSLIIMEGQQYLMLESESNIPNVIISEGSQSTSCVFAQTEGNIDIFACENISIVGPYTVGEMRSLGMEAGGVVPVVPTIPINLVLSPGDTEVTVGWNPVNTAISYTLAWSIGSGAYTEITGITGTGYIHTGLTNGSTYNYKVKAINASGESGYSSVVTGVPNASYNLIPGSYTLTESGTNVGTFNGYMGQTFINLYTSYGYNVTPNPGGSVSPGIIDGKSIEAIIQLGNTIAIYLQSGTNDTENITVNNIVCAGNPVSVGFVGYTCPTSPLGSPLVAGEQRSFAMLLGGIVPNTCGLLPEEITQLNSIQGGAKKSGQNWCDRTYLDFSNKGLTVLPSALSKLNQLEYLYFQNNSITELPTWVGTSFPSLYAFNGSNNLITSIPETFHPATIFANYPDGVVQIIRLANNQITSLPNSWNNTTISNVQQIDLTGNPALGSLSANLGQIGGGGCPSSDSVFTIRENYGVTTDGGGVRVIQSECLFPTFPGKIITWSPNTPAPGAAYSTVGYNAFETENHCGLTSAQVALMNESDAGYRQKMLLGEYSDGFSAQNFTGRKQLFSYDAQGSVGMYTAGWWCN